MGLIQTSRGFIGLYRLTTNNTLPGHNIDPTDMGTEIYPSFKILERRALLMWYSSNVPTSMRLVALTLSDATLLLAELNHSINNIIYLFRIIMCIIINANVRARCLIVSRTYGQQINSYIHTCN